MAKDKPHLDDTSRELSLASDVPRGAPADPEIRQALQRFLDGQRAPRTRIEYRKAVGDFLTAAGISDLRGLLAAHADDVVAFRNRLQERGLSPATIRLRLAAVSGFYREFVVRGELA